METGEMVIEQTCMVRPTRTLFYFVFALFLVLSNIHLASDPNAGSHDFRLGYVFAVVIIISSLPPTWSAWKEFINSWEKRKLLVFLIGCVILSSTSGLYVLGRRFFNPFVLLAVVVFSAYGYLSLFLYQRFRLETILGSYLLACKAAVILGAAQQVAWLLFRFEINSLLSSWGINRSNVDTEGFLIRANSFWQEPAHYGQFLAVATILSVFVLLGRGRVIEQLKRMLSRKWAWFIVVSMLLTFSISALFPMVFALACCGFMRGYRKYAIVLMVLLAFTVSASGNIQERLVGMLFEYGDARYQNLSIWTFYSNFQTALTSFLRAPLGLGPGNHYLAYDHWLSTNLDMEMVIDKSFLFQNARDGSSMVFRAVTEFGLLGLAFFGYLLQRLARLVGGNRFRLSPYVLVELSGILGFLAFSMRQGAYSIFEPWLFLLLAFMAGSAARRHVREIEEAENGRGGLPGGPGQAGDTLHPGQTLS